MNDPNTDLLNRARALVKSRNNHAHYRAIDRGDWDNWGAIAAAKEELLRYPPEEQD